jgi:hypothetical protein
MMGVSLMGTNATALVPSGDTKKLFPAENTGAGAIERMPLASDRNRVLFGHDMRGHNNSLSERPLAESITSEALPSESSDVC